MRRPPAVRETLEAADRALDREREALERTFPTVMVMAESPKPKDTFLLIRGAYDKPGERVEPGVPEVLNPLPSDAPNNRLGLAKWLVDPANPLTARVTVNRFWQMYFGAGLVKTTEDFGVQGDWPSHPDLLDWLATEFIRTGWDVKAMQKLIVTSATYRQDFEGLARAAAARSGEPPARPRSAPPACRGDGSRSGAVRGRSAGRETRRTLREAVPAGRPVEGAGHAGHGLPSEHRAKICTAAACTRSGSAPFLRR